MDITYRPVERADHALTRDLVDQAFRPEDVASFLDGLRADGCILGEWMAEDTNGPLGHIVYSRVWIEQDNGERQPAVMLTPLAVKPDQQRQGIGQGLMAHTLQILEQRGETIFFVLGHPEYYPKAGFSSDLGGRIASPWPGNPAFMARGQVPSKGRLILPPAIEHQ